MRVRRLVVVGCLCCRLAVIISAMLSKHSHNIVDVKGCGMVCLGRIYRIYKLLVSVSNDERSFRITGSKRK
eukprot:scaffold20548_cov223-Amphora_coffeaeformis.AAC.1